MSTNESRSRDASKDFDVFQEILFPSFKFGAISGELRMITYGLDLSVSCNRTRKQGLKYSFATFKLLIFARLSYKI